jgi:hypothetical protein
MESSRRLCGAWIVAAISLCHGVPGCASSAPAPSERAGGLRDDPGAPDAQDASQRAEPPHGAAQSADIRATIDAFLTDPATGDPGKITRFAIDSPDVTVVFRQSLLDAKGASGDLRALMLAAFTAGNVRAQLEAGKNEDMPVPGVRAMVTVYKKLQAKKPDLRVEPYETYAAKQADGTLDAFVTERARKE